MNTPIESNSLTNSRWGYKLALKNVMKLQRPIYRSEKQGKKYLTKSLQKLLVRSKSALLVSLIKVTKINRGKRTAGVDGFRALTETERNKLWTKLVAMDIRKHRPKPTKRIYIEKKNGKLRPLSIPTIIDRIYQNVIKLALEPQWEWKFEPTSYGFRPCRSTHDAIERIYKSLKGVSKKRWIFEGDFKGCFDNLNHDFILEKVGNFKYKHLIEKWLKASFVDNNTFKVTESGTPQGGIISPLLANIALDGMEKTLDIKYLKNGETHPKCKYNICRYADDFVVIAETEEDIKKVKDILKPYLGARGLELEHFKTKITNIYDGFDFLGFNIRRYKTHDKENGKLLIKPSKDSIKKCKKKLSDTRLELNGTNVGTLIAKLNPIIRGTANYWQHVVSKEIYSSIDNHTWNTVYKFLRRLHPNKSQKWLINTYFKSDKTGQSGDKWILTDPVNGNRLIKMSWTPIIRHTMIKGNNSPFEKELAEYYRERSKKGFNNDIVGSWQKLAKKQNYKCPMCKSSLLDNENEALEIHHITPKAEGGSDKYENLQLVHVNCHIEYHRINPVRR